MPTDLESVGVRRRDVGSCKILTQLFHNGFLQQAMFILFLDLKPAGVDKGALLVNLNAPDNYNTVSVALLLAVGSRYERADRRLASTRHLRSAEQGLLHVPFARTSTMQSRAFSVVGPLVWNGLPLA